MCLVSLPTNSEFEILKQRVLMIGHTPPPPGGVAVVMQNLLDSSLCDKYTISVLDISRKRRRYKVVGGADFLSFLYLALYAAKLLYLLYREKPAIIHIQSCTSAFLRDSLFVVLGKLCGRKIVLHLHGFYSRRHFAFKYSILRVYSQFIMNCIDVLILLSESFVSEFDAVFPRVRKLAVPNFVPQNTLKESSLVKKESRSRINVLYVGRLSQLKGTYDLLKAASLLKQDERVQFLLAGLGGTEADEKRIVSQINRGGLEDRVKLLGYIEGQSKLDLFQDSDIFVLPSYTEIFPVVIVEAMAAGMPVIATPVGAVPEIIQDGINGFIVPVGDHRSLAERIRYLVQDQEKRLEMGWNNLQKFHKEYRVDINVDRIDRIYQSLQNL